MKLLIYLAGPYTSDPVGNTRRAIEKAEEITKQGYDVLIPHLSMVWDLLYPHEAKFWYELDFNILSRCDFLYRMKGESEGADREVEFAQKHKIPIIYEEP